VGQGGLEDLRRMTAAMVHRGPDGQGLWHEPEAAVYLGHRRLSIIDLEGGAQPMWTPDGSLGVAFNGEIYNHLELRAELSRAGHRFATHHSDTEVLLHGYREWGRELPSRLNGMWAFAIYDRGRRELFLSRDRFGKKPLYYTFQNGTFAFASELSALISHSHLTPGLDPLSLKKYFAYGFIPAPSSIYRGIFKLPGGHNLLLHLPSLEYRVDKYWDLVLEPFESIPANALEEWGAEIRALLFRAVQRRLMADVPLGIFLSGGIDSSAVAALAVAASGDEKIKSFSIGFQESSFDESAYSRQVASWLHTEHFLEVLSLENSRSLLPEIAGKLDEPMGDSSLLPTYLLCREARQRVTVALGGDGGDELFAGYDPFRALALAQWYQRLVPKPVHQALRLLAARLPTSYRNMSLDFRLKRTLRGLSYPARLWSPVWLGPLEPTEIRDLFREPVNPEELYQEAIQTWDECRQENLVDKTMQFYTKLYLQDDILVKVDRASMMNSLEVRAPYLDIDLVNFVRRIPAAYKFRLGRSKYILKEALAPVLPREILHRSKKGFGVPVGRWFREGALTLDLAALPGVLDSRFIAGAWAQHRQGRVDQRHFLWNLWLLSAWGRAQPGRLRREAPMPGGAPA
jgi:asparagine synthase (glutamine-hydrolysing)